MKHPVHVPLSALALALLLAACGSGGGGGTNEKDVSASPTPPSNQNVTTQSSSTTGTGNSGTGSTGSTPTETPPSAQGTTPTTPATPPVSSPSSPAVVPLISAQGVRGDVLLTMLDQRPCNHYARETTAHDGPLYPEAMQKIPMLSIYSQLSPTNYPQLETFPIGYRDVTCSTKYAPYQASGSGTYEYVMSTGPWYRYSSSLEDSTEGLHTVQLKLPFIVGDNDLTLGRLMDTEQREDKGNAWNAENNNGNRDRDEYQYRFSASSDFSIKLDEIVPFGVRHTWQNYNDKVELMVLNAAPASDTLKLCWNISARVVKRLQCIVRKIPANWQRGHLLQDVDNYIIDDRSSYPTGGTGLASFRTDPPKAEQ